MTEMTSLATTQQHPATSPTKASPTVTTPTTQSPFPSLSRRWLQASAVAVGIVVLVAACGSSSSTKSAAQAPTGGTASTGAGSGGTAGGAGGGARPGTTGKIAQVNPSSIYVQGTSSQVTVNYSAKTTFSQTVTTASGVLKVGDCVTATAAAAARPSGAPSATPSASRTPTTALTATAVTITSTSGSCTLGTGNRGNRAPGAFASGRARPSGSPSFAGRAGGGGGFGNAAFGSVASVDNNGFVVSSTRAGKTTKVTVTTTPTTTFRQQTTATKADLKVGLCATAVGSTDSTGAVTARTIALSTAGANGCTTGFGGFGRGFGGGSGAGSGTAG